GPGAGAAPRGEDRAFVAGSGLDGATDLQPFAEPAADGGGQGLLACGRVAALGNLHEHAAASKARDRLEAGGSFAEPGSVVDRRAPAGRDERASAFEHLHALVDPPGRSALAVL